MDFKHKSKLSQIKKYKQTLSDSKMTLSLTKIFGSDRCQLLISECREFRDRTYTPLKTLFIFTKQVLNPDKSCKNAVAEVVAEQLMVGEKEISINTGPYCKARKRLPTVTVKELVKEVGRSSAKKASASWKGYGRELKVVDGSTVIMPDTKENQALFPQQSVQKKGLGFPIARIVIVMSLTVGTVIDYAIDAFKGKGTGESTLFRRIFDCIEPEDILLGDSIYPSFFLVSDIIFKNADGIFGGQARRLYDFRKGEKLGKKDHIVDWKKPHRPEWMDKETYAAYPDTIRVREFKVDGRTYITTLLDNKKYHKKELAKLYNLRWQVEINLKSIKETMSMDMLSCKTPEMVVKEIGIHFLAYNFIRVIMAEACIEHEAIPISISFKGALQLLNKFMPYFIRSSREKNKILYDGLLKKIVNNTIGNRPGRVEPRAVKRRAKPFDTLNRPRSIEKAKLMRRMKKNILKYACA